MNLYLTTIQGDTRTQKYYASKSITEVAKKEPEAVKIEMVAEVEIINP